MEEKASVNWILDHPKVAALVAFIALAVGFTPRGSTTATWISLGLAAVFGIAMLWGIGEKGGWRKRWRFLWSAFIAFLIISFGIWLTGVMQATIARDSIPKSNSGQSSQQQDATLAAHSPTTTSQNSTLAVGVKVSHSSDKTRSKIAIPDPLSPRNAVPSRPESGQVNSVIENSGKLSDTEVSNSDVAAPVGGRGTILRNLQGGEAEGTKIDSSKIQPSPTASGTQPTGSFAYLSGASGQMFKGNVACGTSTFAQTKGYNGPNKFDGNSVDNLTICAWMTFLDEAEKNRDDMKPFLDKWEGTMTRSWADFEPSKREANQNELPGIREKLTNAAAQPSGFLNLRLQWAQKPPSFQPKLPE